jgi:hypothetical protein
MRKIMSITLVLVLALSVSAFARPASNDNFGTLWDPQVRVRGTIGGGEGLRRHE